MDKGAGMIMQRDCIDERDHAGVTEPLSFIHDTGDGPVHLLVKPCNKGWQALHWGHKVGGAWTFSTMAEANEHALHWFNERYCGHRCSSRCGPVNTIARHKSDDPWGMIRE
jgi:hypothetical protein